MRRATLGMKAAALSLGELLALAREIKGYTLRQLESESGVSNALISQIEHGKVKDPGFATVVRLCEALGVSIERAAEHASLKRIMGILRKEPTP